MVNTMLCPRSGKAALSKPNIDTSDLWVDLLLSCNYVYSKPWQCLKGNSRGSLVGVLLTSR